MSPESFPVFQAADGTSYTVRRDLLRYIVLHVTLDGTAGTAVAQQIGETFESRHAAVATARQWARLRCTG